METFAKQLNNHQSFSPFSNLHLLKLATRFLAPVFFFSILLSFSSLHPFISNFMPLISSFNIDKNYMFLLCNGILVLIAKNSGLKIGISHQETTSLCGEQYRIKSSTAGSPQKKAVQVPASEVKPALVAEEGGAEEVPQESSVVLGEGENARMITQDNLEGKQGDEVATIDEDHVVAEEEEEEEEVTGLLSAEELNKKCEDFIRKMKEGIKFEAQQLVMVQY